MLLPALLQIPIAIADPCTFASASGAWRLEIDPDDRYGSSGAVYRMLHVDELVWSGRLPWAFHHAAISERGLVLGASTTADPVRHVSEIVAVSVDPAGAARVRATKTRYSPGPDTGMLPDVAGLRIVGEPGVFRLDLADGRRETAWSFELASGALVSSAASVSERWNAQDWPVVPVAPRRARARAENHCVRPMDVEPVELVRLGELAHSIAPITFQASIASARDGSFAVLDLDTGRFTAYDAEGARTGERASLGSRFHPWGRTDALGVGRWRVQGDLDLVLDREGAEETRCELGRGSTPRYHVIPTGVLAGASWCCEYGGLVLLDGAGATLARADHRADRRWFGRVLDVAFDSDGGLLVLEDRSGDGDGGTSALDVHSPTGELLATWELASDWRSLPATRARPWGSTVVVSGYGLEPLLLNRATGCARRIRLASTDGDGRPIDALPACDGTELWIFRARTGSVERFALPRELR